MWRFLVGAIALMILLMAGFITYGVVYIGAPSEAVDCQPQGFVAGLFHGLVSPILLLMSIFGENYAMFALCNTGWTYELGYLLGISGVAGGGSSGSTGS